MKRLLNILFVVFIAPQVFGQTGLTVGPPRVFFVAGAGQGQTQYVDVTNPSKDYTLELAVSLEDWAYSEQGDNVVSPRGTLPTSLASWLSISESLFALRPGETKRLQVNVQVPPHTTYTDSVPVRTAMLFVTQLNPRAGAERDGANIRLAVRTGIKIYHRFIGKDQEDIEITNLRYLALDSMGQFLELSYGVTGNIWLQGQIRAEFLNQADGKKTIVDNLAFYCMPGDKRKQYIRIPEELPSGNYTASVFMFFGENNMVKAAEMDFDYEKTI
ncbi:MAG TPA: hypothetical protein PKA53_05380 [Sphingobacterium sp.]|nr:hypothetical protein [Sphingobacterium sp.]